MKRLFFLVVALSLLGVSFSSVLPLSAAPSAQTPVYTIFDVTQLRPCMGDWSHATINPGDYLTILGTVGYVASFKADLVGMHSLTSGDIPVSGLLSVTTIGADIAFQNVSFPTMPIVVSMCQSPFVPTSTPTPLTTPVSSGCYAVNITGQTFFSVVVGTTIQVASGSVDYGSNLGVSWTPLAVGNTLFIPFSGSAYFRGSGVLYVCPPAATATPTVTSATPTATSIPSPCVLNGSDWRMLWDEDVYYVGQTTVLREKYILNTYGVYYDAVQFDVLNYTYANDYVGGPPTAAWYLYGQGFSVGSRLMGTKLITRPGYASDLVRIQFSGMYANSWYRFHLCTQVQLRNPATATATAMATTTRTATSPATRTPLPAVSRTPTNTAIPTATPYPTSVAICTQTRLTPSVGVFLSFQYNAYIRALNGIAYIDGGGSSHSLDAAGIIWDAPTGSYFVTALSISNSDTQLVVEVCANPLQPTPTMTAPSLPCPVSLLPFEITTVAQLVPFGQADWVVDGASVYVNVGPTAHEIRPGTYTAKSWLYPSSAYNTYTINGEKASIWVCASYPPTSTATFAPTWTPGPVAFTTAVCVLVSPTSTTISFTMPQIGIFIPARATATATMTGTAMISITAIIAFQQTLVAGVSSPEAGIAAASSRFSWQSGQDAGATSIALAGPALSWIAVVNPQNPAWTSDGGPLWAIAPFIQPILPVIAGFILVTFARFFLWVWDWFLKLIDLLIKLIELIPFI